MSPDDEKFFSGIEQRDKQLENPSLSFCIKRATLEWSEANLHPLTSVERRDLIGKILGAVVDNRGRDK